MKQTYILPIVLTLAALFIGFLVGRFVIPSENTLTSTSQSQSVYTNHQADLRFTHPAHLPFIYEQQNSVSFAADEESRWELAVNWEETNAVSINDWITTQSSIDIITHIQSPTEFYLINRSVVIDQDTETPIVEQRLQAITVQNGTLYTVNIDQQFIENDTPTIPVELLTVIATFNVTP